MKSNVLSMIREKSLTIVLLLLMSFLLPNYALAESYSVDSSNHTCSHRSDCQHHDSHHQGCRHHRHDSHQHRCENHHYDGDNGHESCDHARDHHKQHEHCQHDDD
ncbi:hypothetical protein [Photobacterium sp. GB-56]|uniref:hypothetical protein n=1 Tax=Photobacterium sp. GB-56 TaxID=2022106 RepID=UPI0011B2053B|nr:hypothetical protein [Photobacterium sp. GB-56]